MDEVKKKGKKDSIYANRPKFLLGDVNGDGMVNVTDVVAVINFIRKKPLDRFVEAAADVNQDGSIDNTDVDEIVKKIFGKN